jgi:hypothetical protein
MQDFMKTTNLKSMKLNFKNDHTNSFSAKAMWTLSYFSTVFVMVMATVLVSCSSGDDEEEPALPTITSFSPTEAVAGIEVTINGTNLETTSSVQINGVEADIVSKTLRIVKVTVPENATTGKIKITTSAGSVTSADDLIVTDFSDILISDFEEENAAETKWHVAQDGSEITVSEIINTDEDADGHYLHIKGADTNLNFWLGGRYSEMANSSTPFGLQQTDATKVYFNVDVKKNNDADVMAKLVFAVYEAGETDSRRNYEIDFPVTWSGWKTISIRADKFHYWNGSGFTTFAEHNGDIETMWSLALYITGGAAIEGTPVEGEFSFDNVVISQKEPLGEELNP